MNKIKKFRNDLNEKWSVLFKDRSFRISFLFSVVLFFFGQYVLISAAQYNDQMFQVVTVGDIILDSIPTYNLSFLFTWGVWFFLIPVAFYALAVRPELAPWALKTYGLFALIRAAFIVMTHLGPPEGMLYLQSPELLTGDGLFDRYAFYNDLFFSGHVGNTFLAALIFRAYKFRWFCLIGSIVMAVTVLLMHVHYSIDVFASFFITYGIYALSDKIFHKWNTRFKRILKRNGEVKIGGLT